MGQLLQIATILLQNATVITKFHVYYKLRQYKQQSWHSNIISDNGLNLFDECAAECVHLCP